MTRLHVDEMRCMMMSVMRPLSGRNRIPLRHTVQYSSGPGGLWLKSLGPSGSRGVCRGARCQGVVL